MKKLCSVMLAAMLFVLPVGNATEVLAETVTMDGVYLGGGDTITAAELGLIYGGSAGTNNSNYKDWEVEVTLSNGLYLAAVVNCQYIDGFFGNYDACQVTRMPDLSNACYAYVINGSGERVNTSVAGGNFKSDIAKVKHDGSDVKFGILFGPMGSE